MDGVSEVFSVSSFAFWRLLNIIGCIYCSCAWCISLQKQLCATKACYTNTCSAAPTWGTDAVNIFTFKCSRHSSARQ